MAELLDEITGLTIVEGAAEDLILDDAGRVAGLVLGDGRRLDAGRVVLTTGTFLGGLIHIGQEKIPARSEEHTPELQSHRDLVCRLLLVKKKKNGQPQTL